MKDFLAIIKDTSGTEHIIPIPSDAECETKVEAANWLLQASGLDDTEGNLVIIPNGQTVSIIIKEI